jgi:hypothetical protein
MPKTIDDVISESEIKDIHLRYCRANDRRDEELVRSCFHRIATDDAGPERDFVASGRYIDRMERRDSEWRIARRVMLVDFTRLDPNPPQTLSLGSRAGERNRNDPSYAMRLKD